MLINNLDMHSPLPQELHSVSSLPGAAEIPPGTKCMNSTLGVSILVCFHIYSLIASGETYAVKSHFFSHYACSKA